MGPSGETHFLFNILWLQRLVRKPLVTVHSQWPSILSDLVQTKKYIWYKTLGQAFILSTTSLSFPCLYLDTKLFITFVSKSLLSPWGLWVLPFQWKVIWPFVVCSRSIVPSSCLSVSQTLIGFEIRIRIPAGNENLCGTWSVNLSTLPVANVSELSKFIIIPTQRLQVFVSAGTPMSL